jgi:hypothetical protein
MTVVFVFSRASAFNVWISSFVHERGVVAFFAISVLLASNESDAVSKQKKELRKSGALTSFHNTTSPALPYLPSLQLWINRHVPRGAFTLPARAA